MKPPRRTKKEFTRYTPNSKPEGLNQVNEGPTFLDKREAKACRIFRDVLRPNGWKTKGRGVLENWSFIPASLAKKYSVSQVFKEGTDGVHYACGWSGLADMLDSYGQDYAPSSLLVRPTEVTFQEDEDSRKPPARGDDDDDETMTDDSTSGNEVQEEAQAQDGQTAATTAAEVLIKQEEDDDDEIVSTASTATVYDNASLLTTLECIKKCREEISWLARNQEFHGRNGGDTATEIMRETIASLYSQVNAYNQARNDGDDE